MFIECKAKRLRRDSRSSVGEDSPLEADLGVLAKAIVQSYKTIRDYQDNKYPHFPYQSGLKIFPVIVTLENWILFGPSVYEMMNVAVEKELEEAGLSSDIVSTMPFSIMAVEELEIAIQAVEVAGISDFMNGKLEQGGFGQWTWLPYIKERFPKTYPSRTLFSAEYDEIFDSLVEAQT